MNLAYSHSVARGLRKVAVVIAVASFIIGFGIGKVF
jgi:hypothetical protein